MLKYKLLSIFCFSGLHHDCLLLSSKLFSAAGLWLVDLIDLLGGGFWSPRVCAKNISPILPLLPLIISLVAKRLSVYFTVSITDSDHLNFGIYKLFQGASFHSYVSQQRRIWRLAYICYLKKRSSLQRQQNYYIHKFTNRSCPYCLKLTLRSDPRSVLE